jgi:hypothetical protein
MRMVEHGWFILLKEKNNGHIMILWATFDHSVTKDHDLLTLLAADPFSSCPEWVLLCLLSCFPHLWWVPTDSFHRSRRSRALLPLLPAGRFQEALDPGNCLLFCWAHYVCRGPRQDGHQYQLKESITDYRFVANKLPFSLFLLPPNSTFVSILGRK